MSDTEFDIVIAVYMAPGQAEQDFNGLVKLVADKKLQVEGGGAGQQGQGRPGHGQGNR